MGKGQDTLAPVLGVLAELGAEDRLVTDFRTAENEGIEDFRRRPVVIAIDIAADMARVRTTIVQLVGRRVVTADIVVGMVVPAVGADTKTHLLLVGHIQFREHVQALGHRTARREVTVTVVVVP
ncbi:hypothetical protein D3C75_486700 [compost metagenome]